GSGRHKNRICRARTRRCRITSPPHRHPSPRLRRHGVRHRRGSERNGEETRAHRHRRRGNSWHGFHPNGSREKRYSTLLKPLSKGLPFSHVELAFFTRPVLVETVPGIPTPTVAMRPSCFSSFLTPSVMPH